VRAWAIKDTVKRPHDQPSMPGGFLHKAMTAGDGHTQEGQECGISHNNIGPLPQPQPIKLMNKELITATQAAESASPFLGSMRKFHPRK
jgi:hypothetical protein